MSFIKLTLMEEQLVDLYLPHTPEQCLCLCTSSSVPKYKDYFPVVPASWMAHTDQLSAEQKISR